MNRLKSFRNYCIVVALSFLAVCLLHAPRLFTYTFSGDDLYMLSNTPRTLGAVFVNFASFTSQYRPLSFAAYALYLALLPHVTLIFIVHLSLLTLIISLIFTSLRKFTATLPAFLLTSTIALSPLFFYHIYTISSLPNVLLLLINILLLHLFQRKPDSHSRKVMVAATVLVFASVLIKESYFLSVFLYGVVAWQHLHGKRFWQWVFIPITIIGVFTLWRVTQYTVVDQNYSFVFTPEKFVENTSLILSWLTQFPRGWQYGAPLPKNSATYLIACVTLIVFCLSAYRLWRSNKAKLGLFMLALVVSSAPYVFLNRILPYYFDSAWILLIYLVGYSWRNKRVHISKIVLLFFFLSAVHFLTISPQWHTYSFVANARETAQNYLDAVKLNSRPHHDTICILRHVDGVWATKDGQSVTILRPQSYRIVSTPSSLIPRDCEEGALILVNDARAYKLYSSK